MGRRLKGRGWHQLGPGPQTQGLKDNLPSRHHALPSPPKESLESQGASVLVGLPQPSRIQKEEESSPDKQHGSAQTPAPTMLLPREDGEEGGSQDELAEILSGTFHDAYIYTEHLLCAHPPGRQEGKVRK